MTSQAKLPVQPKIEFPGVGYEVIVDAAPEKRTRPKNHIPPNDNLETQKLTGRMGGDLVGLGSEAESLQQKGIKALVISHLLLPTTGEIDPHTGNIDDLDNAVDEFHAAGMKVYLDILVNTPRAKKLVSASNIDGVFIKGQLQDDFCMNLPTNLSSNENLDSPKLDGISKALLSSTESGFNLTSTLLGPRLATRMKNNEPSLEQAWATLFFAPAQPVIFYNDENGLLANAFPDTLSKLEQDPGNINQPLSAEVKQLIQLRSQRRSLNSGDISEIWRDDSIGCIAFSRTYRFESTLLVLNLSGQQETIAIPASKLPPGANFGSLLTNGSSGSSFSGLSVSMPPHGYALIGNPASEISQ